MNFKKGHHPRINLVKNENCDILSDSHNVLNGQNYFSQLLNVHEVNESRQIEMHTVKPLVCEPCPDEVEIATEKLKGGKSLCSEIHSLLILFGIRKNCHSGRNLSLYLCLQRGIILTSNYRGLSLLQTMYKVLFNILLSRLTSYINKITGTL
jgi:hypothetical protein